MTMKFKTSQIQAAFPCNDLTKSADVIDGIKQLAHEVYFN